MNDNDASAIEVDDVAMVAMARACDFLLTLEGEAPAVQRVDRHETDGVPWYAVLARDKVTVWLVGGVLAAMAASRGWGRPYVVQSPGPDAYGPLGETRVPLRLVHGSGQPAGGVDAELGAGAGAADGADERGAEGRAPGADDADARPEAPLGGLADGLTRGV